MSQIAQQIVLLNFLTFFWASVQATEWLEVPLDSPQQWQQLRTLVSDVETPHDGVAVVYASPQETAALQAAGWRFKRKITDLESYYAQRAQRSRRADWAGSQGGFRTLEEIETELERLHASYPQRVAEKTLLGYSLEGRPLWALRVSDNERQGIEKKPVFWLDALHHAREPLSGETLLRFANWLVNQYEQNPTVARLLQTRHIILLPCVNPDGYFYNQQRAPNGGGLWRKNRRPNGDGTVGVDLNRNYGWFWGAEWSGLYGLGSSGRSSDIDYRGTAAFSEPETQVIRAALSQYAPKIAITLHSYGQEWMYPWGYQSTPAPDAGLLQDYAQAMAAGHFQVANAWALYGVTNGAADDYYYGQQQELAFTVEMGTALDGFWPSPERIQPLFEQVLPGLLKAAQWSGAWAVLEAQEWQAISGNGDAWLDEGERWQLTITLKNQGIKALEGELHLAACLPLHSQCPWITRDLHIAAQQNQQLDAISLEIDAHTTQPKLQAVLSYEDSHSLLDLSPPLAPAQAQQPVAPPRPLLRWEGTPQAGETLTLFIHTQPQAQVYLFAAEATAPVPYQLPNISGDIGLSEAAVLLWQDVADATGTATWQVTIPADKSWQGLRIALQALIVDPDGMRVSQMQLIQL